MSTTLTEEQQRLLEKLQLWTNKGAYIKADCENMRIWSVNVGGWAYPFSGKFSVPALIELALALAAAPVLTAEQEAAMNLGRTVWNAVGPHDERGFRLSLTDADGYVHPEYKQAFDDYNASAAPSPVSAPAEQEAPPDEFKPTHRSRLLGDYIQLLNDRTRPCAAYRSPRGLCIIAPWEKFDATYEPLEAAPAAAETEPDDDRREEFVRLFESYDNGEIAASFDPKGGYLTFHRGDSIKADFHLSEIESLVEHAPSAPDEKQGEIDAALREVGQAFIDKFEHVICREDTAADYMHSFAHESHLARAARRAIELMAPPAPTPAQRAQKVIEDDLFADNGDADALLILLRNSPDLVERDGRLVPADKGESQ